MSAFLIRARLKRDASVAALAPLLLPEDAHARALAAHRLVWSLMTTGEAATRDFLWREERPGAFLILGAHAPGPSPLFEVEAKPFAPPLAEGDRLSFVLRANATTARKVPGQRGPRDDVVMRALHAEPGDRAAARPALVAQEGTAWLQRQGARHGFSVGPVAVDGYETLRIAREAKPPIQLATLDYAGVLTVTDPARFLPALRHGFGRARAFGCGLMLIRRAHAAD